MISIGTWASRLVRTALAALALSLAGALVQAGPARAQDGMPYIVMIVPHAVEPENHDAFRAWVARFRVLVEQQIELGLLSQTDICAYRSWRVLGPDAAGLNRNFLFVFEPVVPVGNYTIAHYLVQAPNDEGAGMMRQFNDLTSTGGDIIYASPLDPAVDGVDLGEDCKF